MPLAPLPIDAILPRITAALADAPAVVVQAPPGSGKTTRVPAALLDAGLAGAGAVIVLEPRRIAARMAARRVAWERGGEAGGEVGFRVRFEECGGRDTRLWFVTEGVLLRRLAAEPDLPGIGAVVLDEFHERSLDADLCLALLRRLQRSRRPDLKVAVMSATLDAGPVAAYLGAATVTAEGRTFPVEVVHALRPDDRPLAVQVAAALERALAAGPGGDVLVFLPGAAEIRQAGEACRDLAARRGIEIVALHGDLPPAEQDRAVSPSDRPRLILATNVAETSVTIEGVTTVIDPGLARVAVHSPWSGLKTLRVARISRASAAQRAGRAGRTRPGRCLRLYTAADLESRPERDAPEVRRADLAEAALLVRSLGLDPAGLDWFEPPVPAALAAAETLLARLGAVADGRLTATGRRLLRLPVHPRAARLVVEAADRGRLAEGCLLAAVLEERDVRLGARARGLRGPAGAGGSGGSMDPDAFLDPVEAVEAIAAAEGSGEIRESARQQGLEPGAVLFVRRARDQLLRAARAGGPAPATAEALRPALARALLAGYPDRVGRLRRSPRGPEFVLAAGGTADLPGGEALPEGRLLVVTDATEHVDARGTTLRARAATPVDPDDVLEVFLDAVRETEEVRFDAAAGRVVAVRRLAYEGLILEERPWDAVPPEAVSRALAEAARAAGPASLAAEGEDVDGFLARVAYLADRRPDLGMPRFEGEVLDATLRDACEGCRSLADVRRRGVLAALRERLSRDQRRALDALVPESIRLPGGRALRIDYPPNQPPSAASRLQDFFGMAQGPAVLDGSVPVVLHLRSPGGRDVQVTTDLAGFWERHYPALARELRRRYPKHAWPDDPAHAAPPRPGKLR